MCLLSAPLAWAETATVELHQATLEGSGASIGSVTFTDVSDGVEIKTSLYGLPNGQHGFHIHENASCEPMEKAGVMTPAQAAGGHYDPEKTGKHLGPDGGGHKGDLPRLTANNEGRADGVMKVKDLTVSEIKNRSLMVHIGGDNYSDHPEELGGGDGRFACGIIR
ncbi:superoxide dismutase [Cu-Zn] SodC2 [Deltaproteobacteria bacterium Smac51]|nr:superoxide dismutase [Cu-Zn] SodC2 [Deltaproteobacteria bacterium Smac51]